MNIKYYSTSLETNDGHPKEGGNKVARTGDAYQVEASCALQKSP